VSSIHSADYRRLVAKLVEARLDANLTQVQVARQLKRHQSFVSKYEKLERRLDIVEFLRISRIVGLDALAELAKL
jgi:transcriptional regulator with XRE-family HTH domain